MKKLLLLLLLILIASNGHAQYNSKWDKVPEDIRESNVFKRFAWHYDQRAFPFDTIPIHHLAREVEREMQKIKGQGDRNNAMSPWESIGPAGLLPFAMHEYWGVTSGRIRAVAVHPDNPEIVYIGAASGGIWKTEDGGESWQDIGAGLESLTFGAIAIDPSNPNTLYAGSGETQALDGLFAYIGKGIYKSMDGGESWTQITDGFGDLTFFSDIAVSPHDPELIMATMASGSFYVGSNMENEGVWKTEDAGLTWTKELDMDNAYDILFHPTDPDIVYAAIAGSNTYSGIYISEDQGDSWTQHNSGLQPANTITRIQLDISVSHPNILYAVIYEADMSNLWGGKTRAYKSANGGHNWLQVSKDIPLGGNYGHGWRDQGYYDLCIAIDPVDPHHIFIGNIELHETTDGANFSPVRPHGENAWGSMAHVDYHQLVFAPSDPNYFYIGCDGGIYKSTDGGITAESINEGLATLQFYRMASHPSNAEIVFGGMQDNGNAITVDGGNTWQQVTTGDGMECFFDYEYPDSIVYASVQFGYLLKSVDGGSSFDGLGPFHGAWITPYFMHPTEHETLYTANFKVFRATDGERFYQLSDTVAPVVISTMRQSVQNPNNMICATSIGNNFPADTLHLVFVSTDGGVNWTEVTENIPGEDRWISRVETDPNDENTMYILRTGFSPGNKLYKTTDLGETWANISGDLPDFPCNDIFFDPDSTGHLYLANDIGVYKSTNGGETWEYAGDGMPYVPVMDFDFVKIDGIRYLRAGTHGRSIYESKIDITVGTPETIDFDARTGVYSLKINPNPFTISTTLQYELNQPETVIIIFTSQFGQIVDRIEQKQPAGHQQLLWAPDNLPAGVYYFRLQAGDQESSGKVVKM